MKMVWMWLHRRTCSTLQERVGRLPSLLDCIGQVCGCGAGSSSSVVDLQNLPERGKKAASRQQREKLQQFAR